MTPAAASGARDESFHGPTRASYETASSQERVPALGRLGPVRQSVVRPSLRKHRENDEQCAADDRSERPPDTRVDVGQELADQEVAADEDQDQTGDQTAGAIAMTASRACRFDRLTRRTGDRNDRTIGSHPAACRPRCG